MSSITIHPIGYVKHQLGKRRDWRNTVSWIHLDPRYEEALEGLDRYRQIYVLFYLHEAHRPFEARIYPSGDPANPITGAFATRTPNRPNHLGLTLVPLLAVQGTTLTVRELDAFDGSPVLDIKPYIPSKTTVGP
jgi:tRNA-Thr(GGU) m(6)t(6)A37 methyltransferase TsaA